MKDSEPWLPPLASLSNSQFCERLAGVILTCLRCGRAKRGIGWVKRALIPRCIPIGLTAPMN